MISHCGYPLKRPEAVAGTVDRRRLTAGQLAGGGWPVAGGRCRFARGGWPEAGGRRRVAGSERCRRLIRRARAVICDSFPSITTNSMATIHLAAGVCDKRLSIYKLGAPDLYFLSFFFFFNIFLYSPFL